MSKIFACANGCVTHLLEKKGRKIREKEGKKKKKMYVFIYSVMYINNTPHPIWVLCVLFCGVTLVGEKKGR